MPKYDWKLRVLHWIGRALNIPFKVDELPYGARRQDANDDEDIG